MKLWLAALCLTSSLAYAQDPTLTPPATIPPTPEETPAPKSASNWRFGLGASLSLSSVLSYPNVKTSGATSDTGEMTLYFKEALSLSALVSNMQPFSWGFMGNLSFDGKRQMREGEMTFNGTKTKIPGNDDSAAIQIRSVAGNLAYQWRNWYIPFGLNLAQIEYTPAKNYPGSVDLKTGLGLQFGAGILLDDHFQLEAMVRMIRLDMTENLNNGNRVESGPGFLGSTMLNLAYYF